MSYLCVKVAVRDDEGMLLGDGKGGWSTQNKRLGAARGAEWRRHSETKGP